MEQIKKQIRYAITLFVGTSIVAVPMGFMDEVTNLSENIPALNTAIIVLLSLISIFLFYQMDHRIKGEKRSYFLMQVLGSYVLSLLITAFLLSLFLQSPWDIDPLVALKQIIIVSLPASLAGALALVILKKD